MLIKGVMATDSWDEQETAFASVFIETSKVSGTSHSTGKSGDKQGL
jgi:hypothetical protein